MVEDHLNVSRKKERGKTGFGQKVIVLNLSLIETRQQQQQKVLSILIKVFKLSLARTSGPCTIKLFAAIIYGFS